MNSIYLSDIEAMDKSSRASASPTPCRVVAALLKNDKVKSLELAIHEFMSVVNPNNTMKKASLIIVSGLCAFTLTNCAEPTGPNTQRGAVVGGLGGAVIGGIVGHQSGRALEGAAIGGAVGAGSGALYGNAQDQEQRRRYNDGY